VVSRKEEALFSANLHHAFNLLGRSVAVMRERKFRLPLMRAVCNVLAGVVLIMSLGSHSDAQKSVPCQSMVDAARERIRLMQNAAAEKNKVERINCGRDLACMKKADANAAQREREIRAEDAWLTRQIRDCQVREGAQADRAAMERRTARDLNDPNSGTGKKETEKRPDLSLNNSASKKPTSSRSKQNDPPKQNSGGSKNQYGDWVPDNKSGDPCQSMIDQSRSRIRMMQNAAAEKNQTERINCGRSLTCLKSADANAAQRAREISVEDTRLTRQIRDCETEAKSSRSKQNNSQGTYPKTPNGDWDPSASGSKQSDPPKQNSGGSKNQYGDWVPDKKSGDPCQSMIDQSRSRIRMMQNAAAEKNKTERINCGRSLECLKSADANAAQRAREIRDEDTRLTRQIRDCETEAKAKH
jgi:hypothetical protein